MEIDLDSKHQIFLSFIHSFCKCAIPSPILSSSVLKSKTKTKTKQILHKIKQPMSRTNKTIHQKLGEQIISTKPGQKANIIILPYWQKECNTD